MMEPAVEHYDRVALEVSLKPWKSMEPECIRATCEHLFENWRRLIERSDEVCVLMWTNDGSDIYEWSGNLSDTVSPPHYVGFCNYDMENAFDPDNRHYRVNAAEPYMQNPPTVRYRDLKRIINELKETALRMFGKKILVGSTIDPGPEFAFSKFKYDRHPEVLAPDGWKTMPMHFITHTCSLKADPLPYGGFPDGIPDNTSFGTFIGRQMESARKELGYDYIWFSNGFAYTHYPWGFRGELFFGDKWQTEKADSERKKTNQFWQDFRNECDCPIEVRGSNFPMASDISTDGVSHADLMEIGKLDRPPCNPPWGSRALGLEMVAYMSRIAKTRTRRLPFRFYLNDPWFNSNAWYDYYNRETFDIYVPMSVARLNSEGGIDTPTDLSLLTIDTELGELHRDEANESIPHFLHSLEQRADAAGPLVWVYPFDEYDQVLKHEPEKLPYLFSHDWFMRSVLNHGLPMNTVCSSDTFVSLANTDNLPSSTFVAPVAVGNWEYQDKLLQIVRNGGDVMLYGSLEHASSELLEMLGVDTEEPLEGDFQIHSTLLKDNFERDVQPPKYANPYDESVGRSFVAGAPAIPAEERPLKHRALSDGGGLRATVRDWESCDVKVTAEQNGRKRAYALVRKSSEWNGGTLSWIRGSNGFHTDVKTRDGEPAMDSTWETHLPFEWPRRMLAEHGIDIIQDRIDESSHPVYMFIKRRKGAFVFTGNKPDKTVTTRIRTSDGAPVYAESETRIIDGYSLDTFGKTFHSEVRAFVKQDNGVIFAKEQPPRTQAGYIRHFSLANLEEADITLYLPPESLADETFKVNSTIAGFVDGEGDEVRYEIDRTRQSVTIDNYTGALYVCW